MTLFNRDTQALIDAFLLEVASGDANIDRNRAFKQKVTNPTYNGPVIVAEGDSWFCYPQPSELTFPVISAAPKDIVLTLGREFAIFTQAKPGDTALGMNQTLETPQGLLGVVVNRKPDVFLLSAGGNDLLGGAGLERCLLKGPKPAVADYFGAAFRQRFDDTVRRYTKILEVVLAARPEVKAVLHSYAYAVVTGPGRGPWLFEPMTRLGIPPAQRNAVVREIVDRFHAALARQAARLNARAGDGPRVFLADAREAVGANEWFDELHPSTAGFAKVARIVRQEILRAFPLVA